MMRREISAVVILLSLLAFSACSGKSEYDRLVEEQLATNVRQDSLFLGINFGMDRKEFYAYCWELNKQGVLTNGGANMSIQYKLDSQLKFPASMNFYPKFNDDGQILELPVDIAYTDWALWDKNKSNDVLLEDVKEWLESQYGGEFIELESKDGKKTVLVKVDGNRRIRLWKYSISNVRVEYADLIQLEALKGKS